MTRSEMTRRALIRLGGYGLLASGCLTALPAEATGPGSGTPLYLPTTSGGAAGVRFANAPRWFREAPALFVPNPLSGGAGLLHYPDPPKLSLRNQIHSFEELPKLVEQAKSLGTSIVYLMDWCANRGDYLPDPGLGGETALQAGIAATHKAGGRIILCVEGLLIAHTSNVGIQHGAEWSIIGQDGQPIVNPYPKSWKMCPATEGWASCLEGVATWLASYGADGIYFDDWGDPEEYVCYSKSHGHPVGGAHVYDNGQITCARRVRAALNAARPGMVMLTEDPVRTGLFAYIDGSLDWGLFSFVTRWVWNAQGQTDTFLPDMSIDDWHQTLAIGAKLACPHQFLDAPPRRGPNPAVGRRRRRRCAR